MAGDRLEQLTDRTRYDPSEVEPRVLSEWLEAGIFHPPPAGSPEENFSIAIPPPNVTGELHMGHALNGTMQDVLTRTRRMQGRRALWALGLDHAGIATQVAVEKQPARPGSGRGWGWGTGPPGRERAARSWAARRSSSACGSGGSSTARRSSSSTS